MSTQVFIIAFVVSYLGSIPPGTINITSMQLSVQNHRRAAFFFALAASIAEFAYAGVTVRLQLFLSEKPFFTEYCQIITALAMLALGVANLLTKTNSQSLLSKTTEAERTQWFQTWGSPRGTESANDPLLAGGYRLPPESSTHLLVWCALLAVPQRHLPRYFCPTAHGQPARCPIYQHCRQSAPRTPATRHHLHPVRIIQLYRLAFLSCF